MEEAVTRSRRGGVGATGTSAAADPGGVPCSLIQDIYTSIPAAAGRGPGYYCAQLENLGPGPGSESESESPWVTGCNWLSRAPQAYIVWPRAGNSGKLGYPA